MEFQQLVRARRMVRTFSRRPIPDALIERILDNAQHAPSAGFSQGWAFLLLNGETETKRYWDAVLPAAKRLRFPWPGLLDAPTLIVALSHEEAYIRRYAEADKKQSSLASGEWDTPYWHVDTAFASLLMLLTAADAGLGALFFKVADIQAFRGAFDVPDSHHPIGAIALGYALPDRVSHSLRRGRRRAASVVHRGRW
jgi:nitroreductase